MEYLKRLTRKTFNAARSTVAALMMLAAAAGLLALCAVAALTVAPVGLLAAKLAPAKPAKPQAGVPLAVILRRCWLRVPQQGGEQAEHSVTAPPPPVSAK